MMTIQKFDYSFPGSDLFMKPSPNKKRSLTHAQKLWIWENKPHKCNICGKRVSKLSDAEFDHVRAYSKGGAANLSNVKVTHRLCNRMKGKKPLRQIQKEMGVKRKSRKSAKRKRRTPRKSSNPFDIPMKPFRFKF